MAIPDNIQDVIAKDQIRTQSSRIKTQNIAKKWALNILLLEPDPLYISVTIESSHDGDRSLNGLRYNYSEDLMDTYREPSDHGTVLIFKNPGLRLRGAFMVFCQYPGVFVQELPEFDPYDAYKLPILEVPDWFKGMCRTDGLLVDPAKYFDKHFDLIGYAIGEGKNGYT